MKGFPADVIAHDGHLLVLNKPAGISLLADRKGEPCLWDQLKEACAAEGLPAPLLVHRLDKGTSGVLLVALDRPCQQSLTRQFTDRVVEKTYLAVTAGVPRPERGRFDLPLKPGRKSRFRVAGPRDAIECVTGPVEEGLWRLRPGSEEQGPEAHEAQTDYEVLEAQKDGRRALVRLHPKTGRTHQLRVHLAWTGTPIVGDSLYGKPGGEAQAGERLMLHCSKLRVRDEWSGGGGWADFSADMPGEFRRAFRGCSDN